MVNQRRAFRIIFVLLGMMLAILWMGRTVSTVEAVAPAQATSTPIAAATPSGVQTEAGVVAPVTPPVAADVDPHSNCLMCHSNPDFVGVFDNRQETSLFVSKDHYGRSVHGQKGLQCISCHPNITGYPHSDAGQVNCLDCHDELGGNMETKFVAMRVRMPYADQRSMNLPINEFCRACHEKEFDSTIDSAHVKVLNSGNTQAPVCIDCHGSHEMTPPDEPRSKISQTCATCHEAVYSSYQSSVHGAALEHDANPDVPSCIDCHGVHSVRGPRDPSFRGDSIVICGKCHGDKALMEKYGISTAVFNSYLDDFHGRTVNLFREKGGLSSNKAVCFDCHGVHNIRPADDRLSSVYPDNLQKTCQQCHEEASIRFPQAWLSHYTPSWESTPVLFGVDIAYKFLIPGTLGGFALYIGLDARKRWSEKKHQHARLKAIAEEELDEYDFKENDEQ
jgi:hypothetical protein